MQATMEITDVTGVGPRLAERINATLGIATLDELESAAEAGELTAVEGIGAEKQADILEEVKVARAGTHDRVPLETAEPLANAIWASIDDQLDVQNVRLAGSVRRRTKTVGDIDLVVATDDPHEVFETIAAWKAVTKVLRKGPKKLSVRINDIQVDFQATDEASFGAAHQYFTGSMEHNIKLRSHAKAKGYKLSEYGLFERESGERVAGESEVDIYDILGVEYPPPEHRDDRPLRKAL